MAAITPAGAFGFYAGLCLLGCLFCLFCFPETASLSLDEVQSIFADGFGIKGSARMRKQKRELRLKEQDKANEVGNA
jgi:MFS transporter, SP family, solute carrier family 2 (myo-inositol transporter), member 13